MSLEIYQFSVEVWVPESGGVVPVPPTSSPTVTFSLDNGGPGGLGNTWYIFPQLSDSGEELRDKTVKPIVITGKGENTQVKVYGYGPSEDIDTAEIEAGTGYKAGPIPVPACSKAQRSERLPVNVKNVMMHSVRVDGDWDGTGDRDRIDEIVYEVARQGIRR